MRWPLRYQILLPFAGVMLAVVVAVSLLDAWLSARRTQRQIEHQLQDVAETLAESSFPLTDAVLKQTHGLSGAEFVLLDPAGELRASSLAEIETAELPPGGASDGPLRLVDVVNLAGQSYFHTATTVGPRGARSEPLRLHILYPERELREARWQSVYPPLAVGSVLLVVVTVLAVVIAGRVTRGVVELRRQLSRLVQGNFKPIDVPQRNDELGDLVRTVNVLGDELEELRRAIKRSERLALLGQLAGGLAHQLRNSVTGARIAVQLHQRHCRVDQDSLAVALRQLSITESHLQQFLTAGGPTAPRPDRCELAQVVADVRALVQSACEHRGVRLEVAACDAAAPLWADASQLRQLLLNLVVNAIEAAGSGGWVRVEQLAAGTSQMLKVTDSGPGPDEKLLPRLFEPFATGKPEGIGLGLAVAKKIVEAHGGTIRHATSRPTCFEVTLPVIAPSVDKADATADATSPTAHDLTLVSAGSPLKTAVPLT